MLPSAPLFGVCWTLLACLFLVCCGLPSGVQQEFQLQVELWGQVVPAGGSLLVNCSINCPQPTFIKLETFLFKEWVSETQGWEAFQLSNVTGNSQAHCSGFCRGSQIIGSSNITVYWLRQPSEPGTLASLAACGREPPHLAGAPRTLLTIVLLQGEEELSWQPAVGETPEVTTTTTTLLAGREHHGASFSCCTELDLRLHGLGLLKNSSAPREFQTLGFLGPLLTLSGPSVPEGTAVNVTCAAGPRVQLMLDGILAAAPGQSAQLELNATENDDRRSFFCNAILEMNREFLHKNMSVQLRVLLRNPYAVTIVLALLVILGLVITLKALVYVFRLQKRNDSTM